MKNRLFYLLRIFESYVLRKQSHLDFWHGSLEINPYASYDRLGPYYQRFRYKAAYKGPRDENGILLLDYHGKIGKQYNPIAIAQYGLGHYNLCVEGTKKSCKEFLKMADFLVNTLEKNEKNKYVWYHHFDWDYHGKVLAPWYSGLAQGNGISLLLRAYATTGDKKYLKTAELASESLFAPLKDGGCTYTDLNGFKWIEEIIRVPPTHILNGFMWALFGVYDLYLLTKNEYHKNAFEDYTKTLRHNLRIFDAGIWSYYDASEDKMLASLFYHRLHIIQLRILYKMTKIDTFRNYAEKWYAYAQNELNKIIALFYKSGFKLLKY